MDRSHNQSLLTSAPTILPRALRPFRRLERERKPDLTSSRPAPLYRKSKIKNQKSSIPCPGFGQLNELDLIPFRCINKGNAPAVGFHVRPIGVTDPKFSQVLAELF